MTSIEGFRAIAARTGNYRPDENEPTFVSDDALKATGLISCSVRVWQYAHGPWFPITGVARWEEFAPLKTVWAENQPTERKVLDKSGRWADMPFLMLAKCAEAQAIRKGWPEDLSNTFVGEEIEQAAQAAAEGATRERLERIGGHDVLIIDWLDAAPLDAVPLGQLADRIVAFLRERRTTLKPRGRIVFDRSRDVFIIYADRKLMTPATIARIETQFHLPEERTEIQSDFHYQSTETTIVLET